jgi:hypothetical protein
MVVKDVSAIQCLGHIFKLFEVAVKATAVIPLWRGQIIDGKYILSRSRP